MNESALSRRARDKARQRQEILDAALLLFSENGYHNVSMCQIANQSEFAIGTIYKFFNNKEQLYTELILRNSKNLLDDIRKAVNLYEDEAGKLRSVIKAKCDVYHSNLALVKIIASEIYGRGFGTITGIGLQVRREHDEFLQFIASIFASGIKNKCFNVQVDPLILAIALDGITNAFFFRWMDDPEHHPYPGDPEIILQFLNLQWDNGAAGALECRSPE